MYDLNDVERFFQEELSRIDHPLDKIDFDQPLQYRPCPHKKKANKNVRYRAHSDGTPVLKFTCMGCGIDRMERPFVYKSEKSKKVTPEELQRVKKINAQKKAETEAKELARKKAELEELRQDYEHAGPCIDHPYLKLKNVHAAKTDGLRLRSDGTLLCPLWNVSGELIAYQRIYFDKAENKFVKRFKGSSTGGFNIIGGNTALLHEAFKTELQGHGEILVAEGVVTCRTVSESLGVPLLCTYGSNNFLHVLKSIKQKYPLAKYLIICDDDRDIKPEQRSETKAKHAISELSLGGSYVMPDFSILNLTKEQLAESTDFNDLFNLILNAGIDRKSAVDELRTQILTHRNKDDAHMIAKDKVNESKKSAENEKADNVFKLNIPITYPELNSQGKPLNTYGNLKHLLDLLQVKVKWNDMSHIREVTIPGREIFRSDEENFALREITNFAELHGLPTTKIDDHLTSIAQQAHYHPIVDCIKATPWDRTKRLSKFLQSIKTHNDKFAHKLILKWMVSAIEAAFSEKGFASQGVLVLLGPQNLGKTRWVKALDPINCGAVREGMLLDPSSKDSIVTCASHWIVELGELDATFRKTYIAQIKSHMTNQIDVLRFPFARKNSRLPRRTVYVATVNVNRYLIDDTGNRRWWGVEVQSIDLNHGLDVQQVWAEVYHIWKKGESTWLSSEELTQLNKSNEDHEQIDPLEELVEEYFDWSDGWQKNNVSAMTSSEVLKAIGYKEPTQSEATKMGNILMKLTGKKPERRKHTLPRRKIKD